MVEKLIVFAPVVANEAVVYHLDARGIFGKLCCCPRPQSCIPAPSMSTLASCNSLEDHQKEELVLGVDEKGARFWTITATMVEQLSAWGPLPLALPLVMLPFPAAA